MQNMERRQTISWQDPKVSARDIDSISGLDYLKAIQDGRIHPPPVAMLVGYKISAVEAGRTVYELDPHECHYNPFASVHGGIISTLLDTAMTAAVLSTLGKGVGCATAEIKVNFIRPVTTGTGTLRCEARPIHIGKRLATAEGHLKDSRGMLYAHAVCTCSLFTTGKNKVQAEHLP
jgi:uncharacterized protein (TIGR00369 family)